VQCVEHVRFTPESRHVQGASACPLRAKSGHRTPFLLASEGRTTSPSTDHVYTHTLRVYSRRTIQVHSHTRTHRTIRAHTDTRRTRRHGTGRTGGSVATAASALAPRGPVVTPSPVLRDRKQPRRWRKPAADMQARPKLLREPIRFSFGPPKLTTVVYQEAWKREAGSGKFRGNSRPQLQTTC
jgi:hypothetical protein